MKRLLVLGSLFVALLFGSLLVNYAFAQETPEEVAAKYGITFPISELGGCRNYLECRNYCEDPVNQATCVDFAKKKGFYKQEEFQASQAMLQRARTVLGCDTFASCQAFCEKEENLDRCHEFAQSAGVKGGYSEDPRSAEFLSKARQFLGCTSYETCRNFCENPTNRDKCAEFARSVGVHGGYEYSGPGGCTTETTCRAFCENPANMEICRQFSQAHGGRFAGPGGCTDEASCRSYCEKNPSDCPGFGEAQSSLIEYCSKTPGCSWTGTTCQCTSTATYGGDPAAECQKYGCSWTGSYCQCGSTQDYQEKWKSECSKYPGCSWTGTTCQCTTEGGRQSPYPTTGSYDPATECSRYPGCSWNGSTCQCSSESTSGSSSPPTYDPATECAKQSGCSWTGTTCQCSGSTSYTPYPNSSPGVYGASTAGGVLQVLLQYLKNLLGR